MEHWCNASEIRKFKGKKKSLTLEGFNQEIEICIIVYYNFYPIVYYSLLQSISWGCFHFSRRGKSLLIGLRNYPKDQSVHTLSLQLLFLNNYSTLRILHLRDEINNFHHLSTEAIHKVWLRFKKKVLLSLNYGLSNKVLIQNILPFFGWGQTT